MKFYLLFEENVFEIIQGLLLFEKFNLPRKVSISTKSEISRESIMNNLLFIADLRSPETPLQNGA